MLIKVTFYLWNSCSKTVKLPVARYFLRVARYLFLVARYFLLVAPYFLLVPRYFLLVTGYFLLVAPRFFPPAFMGNSPTISHTCYPFLTMIWDEFFIFSSLVLLKEIRTESESKISSCCFCVLWKIRELGGRGSPRFSCVTLVVESSSDLLRSIIS